MARISAPSAFERTCLQPASVPVRVGKQQQASSYFQKLIKHAQLVSNEFPAPLDDELMVLRPCRPDMHMSDPAVLGQLVRRDIDEHLLGVGAMLFKGLPLNTPEACSQFVKSLGYKTVPYEPYAGARAKIGDLDAATNIPPDDFLALHNEMSYNPYPNQKIMLICLSPAKEGGESLMASGAKITALLDQHVIERFEAKGGIKYTRTYPDQNNVDGLKRGPASWQARTKSETREGAERFWTALGCNVEWDSEGTMTVWNVRPAVVPHPITGQSLWFNIAHIGPFMARYGNGEAIEDDMLDAIVKARVLATRALKLEAGDVLMMDNYLCLHGRMPYTGSERSLITVLTAD